MRCERLFCVERTIGTLQSRESRKGGSMIEDGRQALSRRKMSKLFPERRVLSVNIFPDLSYYHGCRNVREYVWLKLDYVICVIGCFTAKLCRFDPWVDTTDWIFHRVVINERKMICASFCSCLRTILHVQIIRSHHWWHFLGCSSKWMLSVVLELTTDL